MRLVSPGSKELAKTRLPGLRGAAAAGPRAELLNLTATQSYMGL